MRSRAFETPIILPTSRGEKACASSDAPSGHDRRESKRVGPLRGRCERVHQTPGGGYPVDGLWTSFYLTTPKYGVLPSRSPHNIGVRGPTGTTEPSTMKTTEGEASPCAHTRHHKEERYVV